MYVCVFLTIVYAVAFDYQYHVQYIHVLVLHVLSMEIFAEKTPIIKII